MMQWADALVQRGLDLGAAEDQAQHVAREVWRQAARRLPDDPPRPGLLQRQVQARTRKLLGRAARRLPVWIRGLDASGQEVLWAAAYAMGTPEVVAAAQGLSPADWEAALERAWQAAHPGSGEPADPGSLSVWLESLHGAGSPQARFDWQRWDPSRREVPLYPSRRRTTAAAASAVLLAGGFAWWQSAGANIPPAPFPLPPASIALTVTLQGGGPLHQRP